MYLQFFDAKYKYINEWRVCLHLKIARGVTKLLFLSGSLITTVQSTIIFVELTSII
jgi:hypothetical protein